MPALAVLWVTAAAIFLHQYPSALDLGLFLSFFVLVMVGAEVGYHRYFAHEAFKTSKFFERVLALLGSISFQGGLIWWTATLKRHHAFSDQEGDPHSPYAFGPSDKPTWKGLLFAHIGWMFEASSVNTGTWTQHVLPLYRDPFLFFLNQHYLKISFASLLLPAVLGVVGGGTLPASVSGFVWGGLIRTFLVSNSMSSLNSICHWFGAKDFTNTKDNSKNNIWLSIFTLGSSWHNNHHAFPRTASNRFKWWQVDLGGAVIWTLERFGIVWDVYRPTAAMIKARRLKAFANPHS